MSETNKFRGTDSVVIKADIVIFEATNIEVNGQKVVYIVKEEHSAMDDLVKKYTESALFKRVTKKPKRLLAAVVVVGVFCLEFAMEYFF